MKRTATVILVLVCLLACATAATATEIKNEKIDVNAKYVGNFPWTEVPVDGDGSATVTLPNETEVTVGGIENNEWRLVIDSVTEEDALEWINGEIGKKTVDTAAFHIFFIDKNDNIHAANGVTVRITPPTALPRPVAFSLGDGATELKTETDSSSVIFTTDGSQIYALGSRPKSGNPDTGDTAQTALFALTLAASVAAFAVCAILLKKKSADTAENRPHE